MAAFNGHEVQFVWAPLEPADVVKWCWSSLWQQLEAGHEYQDSDTLGMEDDDVQVRLRHVKEGSLSEGTPQTDAWFLIHPENSINDTEVFGEWSRQPPPPGVDNSVMKPKGFLSRILGRSNAAGSTN